MGQLFRIPHTCPFLPSLIRGIQERAPTHVEMARLTLYLPYKRAGDAFCRALRKSSASRSIILPQIHYLGVEETPRTIHPLTRQGALIRLIRQHQEFQDAPLPPLKVAVSLAHSLSQILDQTTIEEVDLQQIKTLVREDFADHWQMTLDFLKIILDLWPQYLKENNWIEPYAAHHAQMTERIAHLNEDRWTIIAGSTGTMPATARFIEAVLHHPKGCVILPGLNLETEEDQNIAPTHPQFALARLLKRLDREPASIPEWPLQHSPHPSREVLLKSTFQNHFSETTPFQTEGLKHITCRNRHEESLTIALILRHTLETPGKTATLVTPDATLAKMVTTQMDRWGVQLRNSAGLSLDQTTDGILWLLVLNVILDSWRPTALLALLKHPLVGTSFRPATKKRWLQILEIHLLRGLKPLPGLQGLVDHIQAQNPKAQTLFRGLKILGHVLEALETEKRSPFSHWIDVHRKCMTLLAPHLENQTEEIDTLLTSLVDKGSVWGPLSFEEYAENLRELFKNTTCVSTDTSHPRLQILGTLEARLIQTDLMILSGLNENMWPTGDPADPWLSRPMREKIGLPSLERRIGLMAHDFCQAFAAKELFLTRSTRVDGTPTIPSRFLTRLETALEAQGQSLPTDTTWKDLAQRLETPSQFLTSPAPAPCPPLSVRPRRLSVTEIEMWRRDPYALYARRILKLKPLKNLEEEPDHKLLGILFHKACEQFFQPDVPFTHEAFQRIGHKILEPYFDRPPIRIFWWPAFQQMASRLIEAESRRRAENAPYTTYTEQKGSFTFDTPSGPFTLYGRADRIDILEDGSAAIIDYKTGVIPSKRAINAGFSPQLSLEGLILLHHGFPETPPCKTLDSLIYWGLQGKTQSFCPDSEKTLGGLKALIHLFDKPETPYRPQPFSNYPLTYNDYAHLARVSAWCEEDA